MNQEGLEPSTNGLKEELVLLSISNLQKVGRSRDNNLLLLIVRLILKIEYQKS